MKRPPEDTFTKLCKFIGYGNLEAPVWFIGPEERLLEETEEQIVQHLEIRRRFKPVECLRGVHVRKLKELTCPGLEPKLQGTWKRMCWIMLWLENRDPTKNRLDVLDYQTCQLGVTGGRTLLTELLPLPKKSTRPCDWPDFYSREFGFQGLEDYKASVLPCRLNMLRELVERYNPPAIVCYGKGYWGAFQELFELFGKFTPDQGDKTIQTIERIERIDSVVIRTHHFSRGLTHKSARRIADLIRPKLPPGTT
jgi:hypothetical protein